MSKNSCFTTSRFREICVMRMRHITGLLLKRPCDFAAFPHMRATRGQRRKMAIPGWHGRRDRNNAVIRIIIEVRRRHMAGAYPGLWRAGIGARHCRSSLMSANVYVQWEDGYRAGLATSTVRSVSRVAALLGYRYGRDLSCARMKRHILRHRDFGAAVSEEAPRLNGQYRVSRVSRVTPQAVNETTLTSFAVMCRILHMCRAAEAERLLRKPNGTAAIWRSSNISDARLATRFLFCAMPWMATGVLMPGFSCANGAHASFNKA